MLSIIVITYCSVRNR